MEMRNSMMSSRQPMAWPTGMPCWRIEDLTGVNAREIPLDDPDTMSLFSSSKALGYEDDKVLGPTGGTAIPME